MNLSPHFTLAELTKSQSAARRGWTNDPPPAAVAALRALCTHVLEPLRVMVGRPVIINSGYRSPRVNRAIGGAATSQHVLGEAADIEVPGLANGELATMIRELLPFDQLILEAYRPGVPSSGWVHVSYRTGRLRGEVLTATPRQGGGMAYSPGLKL
jgi:zinc D-Ala-D-Ala carboxypeptidase